MATTPKVNLIAGEFVVSRSQLAGRNLTGSEQVPCGYCGRPKRVDSWCTCPAAEAAYRAELAERDREFR